MTTVRNVWKNEYFKTAVAIVLVVAVVFGLFFGLRSALNTPDPALTVVSGSMSIPYDAADYNFWLTIATPFDRTLSVGDIIIVQGVNPEDLNTNYPHSDIIVFHDPEPGSYNTLIVHRIVSTRNSQRHTLLRHKRRRQRKPLAADADNGIRRDGTATIRRAYLQAM